MDFRSNVRVQRAVLISLPEPPRRHHRAMTDKPKPIEPRDCPGVTPTSWPMPPPSYNPGPPVVVTVPPRKPRRRR